MVFAEKPLEKKRRTRDSNPQPLTGHIISNDAASHSLILQRPDRQIALNLAPVRTKAYPRCFDLQANLFPLFRANLDVYLPFLDLSEK